MKIIYVDMQFYYGKKEWGINYIGQDGFLKSMINLGHHVEPFYYDDYLDRTDLLQDELSKFADEKKPDLIFFSLYTDQFQHDTLDYLKSKYTTIAWFGDDIWRFDNYSKYYATYFTYCITTDKFSISKYKDIGQDKIIYSQWAGIESRQDNKKDNYKYDISFIGMKNEYREWFVDEMKKRSINIVTFGKGWKNGIIDNDEMNRIFLLSRINLNLPNSDSFDMRYLLETKFKSFFNQEISRKRMIKSILFKKNTLKDMIRLYNNSDLLSILKSPKNLDGIKARIFEITYIGGFALSYYSSGIEDYYNIGKEIICFKEIDEAEILIKYYLKEEEWKQKLRRRN